MRLRVPSLTVAAAGAALLAPTTLPAPAVAVLPREGTVAREEGTVAREEGTIRGEGTQAREEGAVAATELLGRLGECNQVSRGRYRTDTDSPATVPVCGTRDAVYWKADLDIDCDGRSSARCNRRTDPLFAPATAFQQSDGRHLSAAALPYIVVPPPSRLWDYRAYGVRGGSVAAVVYRGQVRYAVVGDTGPRDIIGEASYATARSLGIRTDPRDGGVASGVTYIVFRDSRARPIEDHAATVATGERLARLFMAKQVTGRTGEDDPRRRHTFR